MAKVISPRRGVKVPLAAHPRAPLPLLLMAARILRNFTRCPARLPFIFWGKFFHFFFRSGNRDCRGIYFGKLNLTGFLGLGGLGDLGTIGVFLGIFRKGSMGPRHQLMYTTSGSRVIDGN